MYISGNQYNFEERLHQLPTGIADVNLFWAESSGYLYSGNYADKIDKEIGRKFYAVTNSGQYLRTGYIL